MKTIKNPFSLFSEWYDEELKLSDLKIPSAVCLSTFGMDNYPNARFVSFKELVDDSFVITGPLNSRKGIEIENNNNVALTFWWTATEKQIRIQGSAKQISEVLANKYFNERSTTSKAVSSVCEQGQDIDNLQELETQVLDKVSNHTELNKPKDWSGFQIKPIRIEFMVFKSSRFHHRTLYEFEHGEWHEKQIQP